MRYAPDRKSFPVNARFVFISGILSLSLIATSASADGRYQRTKDRKAIVWNNHPLPGDAATWSGDRDDHGYATGHGTLTWFTTEQRFVTGSNLPVSKDKAINRYTGDMIKGKFAGLVVNVDSNGRTFHGTFVDGHKGSDWTLGPAPTTNEILLKDKTPTIVASPKPNESQELKIADQATSPKRPIPELDGSTIEPPAEGPPQSRPPASSQRLSPNEHTSAETDIEAPTEFDDSLRSLVGSPSESRASATASATPQPSLPPKPVVAAPSSTPSKLDAAKVIELADAEARAHGYSLGDFQHPQAQYNPTADNWTVIYDRKSVDGNGMAVVGQPFSITVEDKTKKATFAPEK